MSTQIKLTQLILIMSVLVLAACGGGGTNPATETLLAPQNVSAEAGNADITVFWNDVNGATGYKVYYSESEFTAQMLPDTSVDITIETTTTTISTIISGLTNGNIYYIAVQATKGRLTSEMSAVVSATPKFNLLATPLGITFVAGDNSIDISWDVVPGATGYKVYYSESEFTARQTLTVTSVYVAVDIKVTLINLDQGTTYHIAVQATKGDVTSALSKIVSTTLMPAVVTNLRVDDRTGDSVTLRWTAPKGADSYKVYQSDNSFDSSAYDGVTKVGEPTQPQHTVTNLAENTRYYFRIVAVNSGGDSGLSNQVQEKTTFPAGEEEFNKLRGNAYLDSLPEPSGDVTINYVFIKPTPTGTGDGSSWANAKGVAELRKIGKDSNLDISTDQPKYPFDASADNIYFYLVKTGVYKPTADTTDRTKSFSMREHVIISGNYTGTGFNISSDGTSDTIFSGNIGMPDTSADNSEHVVATNGIAANSNAILHRVKVTAGYAKYDHIVHFGGDGGGVYNINSSAIFSAVTISGNYAIGKGGGVYNSDDSSAIFSAVTISGNESSYRGGGVYNSGGSLIFSAVTISGNEGIGVSNQGGSPIFSAVTISGNEGGGVYSSDGSPIFSAVTIFGNKGSGVYNYSNSMTTFSNSIIWGNVTKDKETEITLDDQTPGTTTIANSIVKGGITDTRISNQNINDATPDLEALADNSDDWDGVILKTHAIDENSSAKDKGLYIRQDTSTDGLTPVFYYSENGTGSWHTNPLLTSGDVVTLPDTAELITDGRGFDHVGKPDIGAFEYGGTSALSVSAETASGSSETSADQSGSSN